MRSREPGPEAKELAKLRRAAGLTQAELAARCALSVSYVTKLESGVRPMTAELRQRLNAQLSAAAVGATLLILLENGRVVAVYDNGTRRAAQVVELNTEDAEQQPNELMLRMLRTAQTMPAAGLEYLARRTVELLGG